MRPEDLPNSRDRVEDSPLDVTLSVPSYRADPEGRVLHINQAAVELLGWPDKSLLEERRRTEDFLDPRSYHRLMAEARRSDTAVSAEHELIHLSGRSIWVSHFVQAIRDDGGEVVGFQGLLADITARRKSTDRLERNEERYRTLFDSSPVALWEEDFSALERWLDTIRERGVTDLRSYLERRPEELARGIDLIRIADANQAAIDLVEAPDRDQVLGRMPHVLVVPSGFDAFAEQMLAIWERRSRLSINIRGQTFSGRPLWCRLEWVVPPREGGLDTSRVVVAITDMTESEVVHRELDNMMESRDRFISSASHHLRTPLTVVMGYSSELSTRWDEFNDVQRRTFVESISRHVFEIADMIENLLVAARADIGSVTIRAERFDLTTQIDAVIQELEVPTIRLSSEPSMAYADPLRVRHILRSLINNAVRHGTPPIEVVSDGSAELVSVTVRDAGPGIPEYQLDGLFTRYKEFRHDPRHPGPLGIGLSVARSLARLMGGDVSYVPAPEKTEFILTLPSRPLDSPKQVSQRQVGPSEMMP
jgi:PAS domain S-box-containing protein